MKTKIDKLMLTGHASLKTCRKGVYKNWLTKDTQQKLADFLWSYHNVDELELKRLDDKTIKIVAYSNNKIKLSGLINLY